MTRLDRAAALFILALVAAIIGVSVVGLQGRGLPPGRYLLALHPASDRVRSLVALSEPDATLRVLAEGVAAYSPEPGGSRVAYVDNHGALWVLDAATGERPQCPTVVCPTRCADPARRPGTGDDTRIAFRAESSDDENSGRLWWVDPAAPAEAKPIFADPTQRGREPRWSADGVRLAYTDSDTGETVVYHFARPRGAAEARFAGVRPPYAFSPDGERLLFAAAGGLSVVRSEGGRARRWAAVSLPMEAIAALPDGVLVAHMAEDGSGDLAASRLSWLNTDGEPTRVLDTPEAATRALVLSPDGLFVAAEQIARTGDARLNLDALPALYTFSMNDPSQPPTLWLENTTAPDWLVWE